MSISTYSELKSAIADWLLRDDLTAVIPTFIALAEAQLNREIRDHRMVKRSTAEIDTEYTQVPPDWLESIRFELNTTPITPLVFVSPDQASEERVRHNLTGKPRFFTVIGQEYQVIPAPDGVYEGELTYYGAITPLSDAAPANWLLTAAPDIYLYAALMQAAPYLDDDARIGTWATLYGQASEALRTQSERARYGASSLRIRAKALA